MVGLAPRPNDPPPPGQVRTADLLAALSLASDLAIGIPAEHAVRSCYIGMHVADHLGLSSDQQVDVYYAELLMDAGCTSWTSQLAGFILSDEIVARRVPASSPSPTASTNCRMQHPTILRSTPS